MAQVCPAKRTCLDLKNCIVFLLLFPEGGRVGHLGAFCIQSLNIRWTWQSHMGEATQDFGTRTNAHKKHQDSRLTIISINSSSGLSRDLWRLKQEMPKKWLRFYKGTSDQDDDMIIFPSLRRSTGKGKKYPGAKGANKVHNTQCTHCSEQRLWAHKSTGTTLGTWRPGAAPECPSLLSAL